MKDIPFEIANPGATEEEIAVLEKRFHFQMPQNLREFYLKHNGVVFPSGAQLDPESCQLNHHRLKPVGSGKRLKPPKVR